MLLALKMKEGSYESRNEGSPLEAGKARRWKRQGMQPSHFAFKDLCWISDSQNQKLYICLVLSH